MAITKILVPITNAIDSEFLNYTRDLACEHNADLIILYITSPLSLANYYTYPSMLYSIASVDMDNINIAHDSLRRQIDTILEDFPHETVCLIGATTDTIIDVATQKQADLIVVQGPPATHSAHFLSKSKADKLSKKANIPVQVFHN
ncbi:MAG: universal stress protein [Cellulosilyticaceae bacterium]